MNEIHCYVSGNVQGVGFRQTAKNCALEHHLSGFAKNLEDGRVEILACGARKNIDLFLSSLEKKYSNATFSVDWGEAQYKGSGFRVL